jgi:2,4-dienoyl-CoA reductase-like NADH-dependent reductase (Old Yellow Enzyme family)
VFLQKDASRRSRPLEEEHIEKISSNFIVSQNSVPVQLAHAGRKASAASPWNGGKNWIQEVGIQ